ncbi:MAG: AAA family ATPase [Deltaproteobacteria bacterium]|nr:AAA family ATPase [Deltaproteobacteria bacterium]
MVLEGLDGTGKSTLASALCARLGAVSLRTPPEALAAVRPAVDAALAPSPIATQLFYAGTVALASDLAGEALAAGRSVVLDRYWLSTLVYASCRPQRVALRALESRLRRPDLTVYLTTDERVRAERLAARGVTRADRDSLARHRALRRRYDQALLTSPLAGAVLRLDAGSSSPEALADAVLQALALRGAA